MHIKTYQQNFKTNDVPVSKPGGLEVSSSKVDNLVGHPAMTGHQSTVLAVGELSNGLPARPLEPCRHLEDLSQNPTVVKKSLDFSQLPRSL